MPNMPVQAASPAYASPLPYVGASSPLVSPEMVSAEQADSGQPGTSPLMVSAEMGSGGLQSPPMVSAEMPEDEPEPPTIVADNEPQEPPTVTESFSVGTSWLEPTAEPATEAEGIELSFKPSVFDSMLTL